MLNGLTEKRKFGYLSMIKNDSKTTVVGSQLRYVGFRS